MSEQQTPTPWRIFGDDNHIMGISYKDAERMRVDHSQWTHNCSDADARRIVACVNACEGIPTDALIATCDDANDLKDFDLAAHALIERVGLRGELELARQQRDELLAALKEAIGFIAPTLAQGFVHFESQTAIKKAYEQARNAIAKAEQ